MATRSVDLGGKRHLMDHAAQFFTASDARFVAVVEEWERRGWVKQWKGRLGRVQVKGGGEEEGGEREGGGGASMELLGVEERRYIGIGGMMQLCEEIIAPQARREGKGGMDTVVVNVDSTL